MISADAKFVFRDGLCRYVAFSTREKKANREPAPCPSERKGNHGVTFVGFRLAAREYFLTDSLAASSCGGVLSEIDPGFVARLAN
jgi:hypothetical protein